MKRMKCVMVALLVIGLMSVSISAKRLSEKEANAVRKAELVELNRQKDKLVDQINLYNKWIKKHEIEIIQLQTLIGYLDGSLKILPDEPKPKKKKKAKKEKKK